MTFKIESGVPIKSAKGRPHIYPYERMKSGDSFFVEAQEGENPKYLQTKLSTLARRYSFRYSPEAKYTTSIEKNEEKIGGLLYRYNLTHF
jgi:hypothetical protein